MASVTVTDPAILADLVEQPGPAELDPRAEAKEQAVAILTAGLTDAQRDVLGLRLEGFSLAKIANMLDITVWSVRGRLERADAVMRRTAEDRASEIADLLGW
jgi:DNA-directed RNA polymerase specialized sigma24 family protein